MTDLKNAHALLMACKGIMGTQHLMDNGQLWTFEDIRMIVHYVDGGEAKQEVQRIVAITEHLSIYVLTGHLMGVQGVDLEARFVDFNSKEEYFRSLELFLTKIQMR